MPESTSERAAQAFRRLLVEGQSGGQAKVDALVALAQRTVLIPTWAPRNGEMRTLVNSSGEAALPIFTDEDALTQAGRRFGWLERDGSVWFEEVGAREAMRRVVRDRMKCLVIDVAAGHALEASREELTPLVTSATRSDSTGPFAAVGRISSTMLEAARRSATPTPGSLDGIAGGRHDPTPRPQPRPAPVEDVVTTRRHELTPRPEPRPAAFEREAVLPPDPPTGSHARLRTPSTGTVPIAAPEPPEPQGMFFAPVLEEPSDEALDELAAVLREYPEIEWGTLCRVSHVGEEPTSCVAIRVEPAYRQRVPEIEAKLLVAGVPHQLGFDVVLVDDPKLVQEARHVGLAFFPWKRRKSSP